MVFSCFAFCNTFFASVLALQTTFVQRGKRNYFHHLGTLVPIAVLLSMVDGMHVCVCVCVWCTTFPSDSKSKLALIIITPQTAIAILFWPIRICWFFLCKRFRFLRIQCQRIQFTRFNSRTVSSFKCKTIDLFSL